MLLFAFMGHYNSLKKQFEEGEYKKYFYLEFPHLDFQKTISAILQQHRAGNPLAYFDLQLCTIFKVEPEGFNRTDLRFAPTNGDFALANTVFSLIFFLKADGLNDFLRYKESLHRFCQDEEINKALLLTESLLIYRADTGNREKALGMLSHLSEEDAVSAVRQHLQNPGEKLRQFVKAFFERENAEVVMRDPYQFYPLHFIQHNEVLRRDMAAKLAEAQAMITMLSKAPYTPESDQRVADDITKYLSTKNNYAKTIECREKLMKLDIIHKLDNRFFQVFLKALLPRHKFELKLARIFYCSDPDFNDHCKQRLNSVTKTNDFFTCLDVRFGEAFQWEGMEGLRPQGKNIDHANLVIQRTNPFSIICLDQSLYYLLKSEKMPPALFVRIKDLYTRQINQLNLHAAAVLLLYNLKNHEFSSFAELFKHIVDYEDEVNVKIKGWALGAILLWIELNFSKYPSLVQNNMKQKIEEIGDRFCKEQNPLIPLFYCLNQQRNENLPRAAEFAELFSIYDKGEQLELIAKRYIEKKEFKAAFDIYGKLGDKEPKFALMRGLCHAFGQNPDEAMKEYAQVKEPGGWWLMLHLKYTFKVDIELPKELGDSKLACECLSVFDKKQKLQDLLRASHLEQQFAKDVAEVSTGITRSLNENLNAEYQERALLLRAETEREGKFSGMGQRTKLITALKERLDALKLELLDRQLKEEIKSVCEQAAAQMEQKAKERVTLIVKCAKQKVAELESNSLQSVQENLAKIQKELEESLTREQELIDLKQQVKKLEQKTRELEKALALKEQEKEQELLLLEMEKEWTQEISQSLPPQHIAERVGAKIDQLFDQGGDSELLVKISKHFWNIKDAPTPHKKEMLALLSLLGFQQNGQRGSHLFFVKEMHKGRIFCLFWSHENNLTQPEKKACLERVLLALEERNS